MGWLAKHFSTMSLDPATLDHCPLNVANEPTAESKSVAPGEGLSHAEKLALAAQRAGKAFRCAADGLPREIKRGPCGAEIVTVGVAPAPVPEPPVPNVITIQRKKS